MRLIFHYNPRKAAQAAAEMVRLNGGRMGVYALIKLLYFADRKALSDRGRPITGDVMVSMPYGPVLSRILDEIDAFEDRNWGEYLTPRENNMVSLRQAALESDELSTDELSTYEREILKATHENYGHYGFRQLKEMSHALPEYVDPDGSSIPIDPAAILLAEGWSNEEIQDAAMSAREEKFFVKVCQ